MDTDRYSLRLSLRRFWSELARRKVWETLLAYGAVVFVLLQLGEIVLPAFSAPAWALPALVRCCFLGFPVVLALAWIFDLTPGGVRKTECESKEAGGEEPAASAPLLPRFGLIVVTLATVGGLGWFTVRDTLATEAPPSAEAPSGGAGNELPVSSTGEDVAVGSLAVLPLDDFSEEEGGEYFTAGLHEELVSQLSRIGSARILSRTSVVQFDRTGKTMPVIAEELGVEGVVEGSVFRAGDRVRITVQLIHGPTDRHLWANSYEGTLEDAIALQREVAEAIAREVQAELFPDDPLPTSTGRKAANAAAQDAYLKGRYAQSKGTPEALDRAVRHYQAALEHDSSYVPAYAGLAASRLLLSLESADSRPGDPTVLDSSVTAPLTKALVLDEKSPEARAVLLALGRSFGTLPGGELARKAPFPLDSAMILGIELGAPGTELGRQLQRSLVRKEWDLLRRKASPRLLEGALHLRLAGDHDEAERALREIVRQEPEELGAWRALDEGDRDLLTVWIDPVWDPVRHEVEFRTILADVRTKGGGRNRPGLSRPLP